MSTNQPFDFLQDSQELGWLLLLAGVFCLLIIICTLEELYLKYSKKRNSRRPMATKPKLKRNRR